MGTNLLHLYYKIEIFEEIFVLHKDRKNTYLERKLKLKLLKL